MQLPNFPMVSDEILRAIAERHGVRGAITRLPALGVVNAVWLLGDDLVLRVPRQHPAFTASAYREAAAVPAARAAGVRTPALVAFDDSLALLPVPFLVYERIHGRTLGLLDLEPDATPEVWRELGRDLARLHRGVTAGGAVADQEMEARIEPRPLLEALTRDGYITASEERWLGSWLERLAPAMQAPLPRRFVHGDMQAMNIMVRPDTPTYLAVLDWGTSGWGDPAWDFTGVPLRAVPFMLAGHRALAPLDNDETVEARILWRHLQSALWLAHRPPQPDHAWVERPLAMLLEIMRFLLETPDERWRRWRP